MNEMASQVQLATYKSQRFILFWEYGPNVYVDKMKELVYSLMDIDFAQW